ncbi:LysR family transcriptional regulator [Burkholderia guangdongensis]|uniref:LysR substrate-binding domain-containing protein n=1 Tax=Burkholderia guangdongensis TaxID=1792500 RepID=UPI0015CA755B|nr:LysR family transcriptional regulator [Burkholderia guangdongensis]
MNLRQLEHVIALAEEGSFARAAQRVHLSQPALSRSIQTIEDELGIALFDRTTRDVQITSAGEMVVRRAKKMLFEARCLVRDVDLMKHHDLGSVSFGAGPYPAAMLLPAILDELARSAPKMRVRADVVGWPSMLEELHRETLDFLVVDIRGIQPTSEINVIALPRHHAAWYVREGHPLARMVELDATDLHDYPIVSAPMPDAMREALRKWLRFPPNHEMDFHVVCNDVNVLQEYTRKTDALLLLTTHALWNPASMAGLVPLSLPMRSPLWLQLSIVYLAGRTLSPAAEHAIRAVQRAAAVSPASEQ